MLTFVSINVNLLLTKINKEVKVMAMKKTLDKGSKSGVKPKKKRWSKDDTELFLLSAPTLLWFLIFSYMPMFGIIIAFKVYKLAPGGHGFLYNLLHS